MKKTILKFKSPKLLNELTKTEEMESVNWVYIDKNSSQLELDTETWNISVNEVSEKIDKWMVNEDKNLMKLESDESDDVFEKLDYTFAVSMIGQLTNKENLLKYLDELGKIYNTLPEKPTDKQEGEKDINDNDKPKDI